jgi:hypothetical protein
MRDGFRYVIAAIGGAIVLSAPAVAVEKIKSAGDVVEAVVEEGGGALNAGMDEVQGIGAAPAEDPTTATTAPEAGSGRG